MESLSAFSHNNEQYDEAVSHYKWALTIKEKAFGVDHTADTMMGLGNTYDRQRKYDEAIAQYERSLRICEKVFGVDHIDTADTIMNIGLCPIVFSGIGADS